jgi:hypothetical protein
LQKAEGKGNLKAKKQSKDIGNIKEEEGKRNRHVINKTDVHSGK